MAVNKKSNLLECIFISKKSLEISLNLTSQIKQLSLTHFVLIVTEPNLEARSFYSEYRGILAYPTWRCPYFSVASEATYEPRWGPLKGTVSAQQALQGSETRQVFDCLRCDLPDQMRHDEGLMAWKANVRPSERVMHLLFQERGDVVYQAEWGQLQVDDQEWGGLRFHQRLFRP